MPSCCHCRILLPVESFNLHSSKGFQAYCKSCASSVKGDYLETVRGFLWRVLNSAKTHTDWRISSKKSQSKCIFTIDYHILKEIWDRQNGRCHYSNIPMSLKRNSDWRASLDPDHGYTKDNVVFCCYELNHTSQWSKEKLLKAITLSEMSVDEYDPTLFSGPKRKQRPRIMNSKIDEHHTRCTSCSTIKSDQEFGIRSNKKVQQICRTCKAKNEREARKRPERKLQGLLTCSVASSKQRNFPPPLITIQDLKDCYHQQRGRCHYSNIYMTFEGDWKISLERLDPALPYTKDNIALICWEFNTFCQFSKTKFDMIKESIKARNTTI